jgi:hypothetical protein
MMPQADANSLDFHRALVTIGFFGLNDFDVRSDLFLERAIVTVSMMPLLEDAHDPNATAAQRAPLNAASIAIKLAKSHGSCASSFERLFIADRKRQTRASKRPTLSRP